MADIPLIGSKPIDHDGPTLRLMMCFVCNTIEELPEYSGPPEHDYLLEIAAEKHEFPSGERHMGKLFILPVKTWANEGSRKAIIEQLRGGGSAGLDAMTPEGNYYSTKMQFAEDAMTCYNAHNRPQFGCSDYGSPEKRLLPNTAKERKDVGLEGPANAPGPKIYLCNFCPMHSIVTTNKRFAKGMYND